MKLSEIEKALEQAVIATESFFEKVGELPPTEQLAHYYRLKMAREALDAQMKRLTKFHQHQQYNVMPQMMIRSNIRTFTDQELGIRFGMSSRYSAKMLNKEKGFDWLRSEGQGALIQETVNAQTLGAFAGRYVEETGEELPDDIFDVKQVIYTTTTKAAVKKRQY